MSAELQRRRWTAILSPLEYMFDRRQSTNLATTSECSHRPSLNFQKDATQPSPRKATIQVNAMTLAAVKILRQHLVVFCNKRWPNLRNQPFGGRSDRG